MIDWLLVARANRYGLTADTEIVAEAIRQTGGSCETASTRARGNICPRFSNTALRAAELSRTACSSVRTSASRACMASALRA